MNTNPVSEISETKTLHNLLNHYHSVRKATTAICAPLETEDYVVQPIMDVSPPKWHLAHTTWFFETFILREFIENYRPFDPNFAYLFNSYYVSKGNRWNRNLRGSLSRPTVSRIKEYREYVDDKMIGFLSGNPVSNEAQRIITLGLQHEQQHQELLYTDIKYILGTNPLHPAYDENSKIEQCPVPEQPEWKSFEGGVYDIGAEKAGDQTFDNEFPRHRVYLEPFAIAGQLTSNKAWFEFMMDGGYDDPLLWHSDGWAWKTENHIAHPKYWEKVEGTWCRYALN